MNDVLRHVLRQMVSNQRCTFWVGMLGLVAGIELMALIRR